MPKNVKQKYSKKEFDKDLKELEILLKEGGSSNNLDYDEENDEDNDEENDEDFDETNQDNDMTEDQSNLYGGNMEDEEDEEDQEDEEDDEYYDDDYDEEDETLDIKEGGKKGKDKGPLRHFKLVELNGKPVLSSARPSLTEKQTPIAAARKLLTSITRGMSEATKLKSKTIFKMKETTRTSENKKVYGPYIGTYEKNKGSVNFTKEDGTKVTVNIKFKPVVKLYKGDYKGGSKK